MSSQSKAQKAVLRLRKCLYRARDHAAGKDRQINKTDPLYSRFQKIDGKLDALKDHFPRVKGWEESLLAKFTSLEHDLYSVLAQSKNRDHGPDIEAHLDLLYKRIEDLNKDVIFQSEALRLPAVKEPGLESAVLLRYGHDEEETSTRKLSQEWRSRGVEEKILASAAMEDLRVSYDNLDSLDLKLCCLFLSVFPEKAVIKKRPLIYWWIGEGLITHTGDETAEELGESMFAKLINLGLIEPYHDNPAKPSPIVTACTIHPWVRYMLVLLAKEASLFDFDPYTVACDACSESRRACLTSRDQDASNSMQCLRSKEDNLSSVFNVSERYLDFAAEWLPKLKKIVVLQLGRWHHSPKHHIEVVDENFLNGFGVQMHLKYLSLRGISRITVIPKSIVELLSLEILDLKACHNLEKLPPDIGSLRSLTHLIISDCPLLESMPKGIEKLSDLQVLKGFVIGNSKQTPCKVADLVELKALRRLSICIANEAGIKDKELRVLKEIKSLNCLTISWGVKSPARAALIDLSFPPNLEKLSLSGIPRTEIPTSTVVEPKTKGKEALGGPREQHPAELRMKKENPAESPEIRRPQPSTLARIYSGLKTRVKAKEVPTDTEAHVPQRSLKELKPSSMRKLKRLYIRGGELSSLNHEVDWVWAVEILQLKYLRNFKIDRDRLWAEFPHLTYLDVKCDAVMEHENSKDIRYKEAFVLTKRDIEEERSTRRKVNN